MYRLEQYLTTITLPKHLLLLPLLLFIIYTGNAQNRATIKGRLVDSIGNQPVELATVAVLNVKDSTSSLVSYTTSTKTGEFALHNLPAGVPLKILITFISYKPFRKLFTLVKGETVDLGTIAMTPKQLQEISITGERVPIVIRADTIEFNAEAFKTRPNAVVEELLKKLPGVEVDINGTITVNGKSVSKLMIDGKEFFANDPKIASKNLDASLIAKVQIYDDREDDPDHLIEDSKVNKIINLKFKKALKKSVFGKVFAGGGSQGRYESGGLYNMFRDTLQISLIGVSNNLNKTGISREDLYNSGGFNRAGDIGTSFGGNSYSGNIQTVTTGGFNINNDYGKKLKLNLVYFYTHTAAVGENLSNTQQFFPIDTLSIRSHYSSNSFSNKHSASFSFKWNPDSLTQIKYAPIVTFNNSSSHSDADANRTSYLIPEISDNTNVNQNYGNSVDLAHSFSYYRRFKKKYESITITNNVSVSPGGSNGYYTNNLLSYTSTQPSMYLNRHNQDDNKNVSLSGNVLYRYPIVKKFIADISVSGSYSQRGNDHLLYDFNPANNQYSIYVDSLSTDVTRYLYTEGIKPGFTYNITKKITLIASVTGQFQQITNQFNKNIPDLKQRYFYFLPNVQLRLGGLSINYDASINQPSISDLQPIKLVYSPLYTYTGNPDLVPTKRNNFTLNYYTYKAETQVNFNIYGGATIEENSIYRQRTSTTLGAQTSRPINRDGLYNMYSSVNYGKRFKKVHDIVFGFSSGIYGNYYHSFFQLNADEGFQNTAYFSLRQSFSVNWKDVIDLEPSYNIANNITYYTGVAYKGLNYTTQNVDTRLTAHLPKKIDIESSYAYTYNPLASAGFQKSINLFSMTVARQIMKKDRGEIKLSCYDLFDQNISSYRYADANSISDTQSQILKRYFLLTLQFKFNKAITK